MSAARTASLLLARAGLLVRGSVDFSRGENRLALSHDVGDDISAGVEPTRSEKTTRTAKQNAALHGRSKGNESLQGR
jgi:hypothetical protein